MAIGVFHNKNLAFVPLCNYADSDRQRLRYQYRLSLQTAARVKANYNWSIMLLFRLRRKTAQSHAIFAPPKQTVDVGVYGVLHKIFSKTN